MSRLASILASSNPTADFIAACAQNAGITGSIALPSGVRHGRLQAISILSVENLAWEVWIFSAARVATIAADVLLGKWTFGATDGQQIAGAGLYHYFIDGIDISCTDAASTNAGKVYLVLVNRSAAAKTAGAGGGIKITLHIEPASVA
jgi:hypothetical protein